MRKLFIGIAAVALLALFAVPTMADYDPWAPDQTKVAVKVIVEEIAEVFTDTSLVTLKIENCGNNKGGINAVQRDIKYLSNVDFDVLVSIDGDIPDWTQFHILINPTSTTWLLLANSGADKTINWRLENTYQPAASGGATPQVTVTAINDPVAAFSGSAFTDGLTARSIKIVPVQYFADARNAIPDVNQTGVLFNVVWTIAHS